MSDLFMSCLGEKFDDLAPLVKQAHTGRTRLVGDAAVVRGNILARFICNLTGVPPATQKCSLIVQGNHDSQTMTWNRYFNDFLMNSFFYKKGVFMVEKLGPIHMKLELDVTDGVLTYRLIETRVFGIPAPRFMSPRVVAIEKQFEDKYRFSVQVEMPLIGTIVSYFGDMQVETLADQ